MGQMRLTVLFQYLPGFFCGLLDESSKFSLRNFERPVTPRMVHHFSISDNVLRLDRCGGPHGCGIGGSGSHHATVRQLSSQGIARETSFAIQTS